MNSYNVATQEQMQEYGTECVADAAHYHVQDKQYAVVWSFKQFTLPHSIGTSIIRPLRVCL